MVSDPGESGGTYERSLKQGAPTTDPGDSLKAVRDALNPDDQRVLRLWRESLSLQDVRYESKGLMALVAAAMVDDDFRNRLVHDTAAVLAEFSDKVHLPEGTALRFLDNSADTLNVVLPPRAGEMSKRPAALNAALKSRTSSEGFFQDDFDMRGDLWDNFGHIDGDGHPPRDG